MSSLIQRQSAHWLPYPRTQNPCTILSKDIGNMRYLILGQNAHELYHPRTKRTLAILSKDIAPMHYLIQGHSEHALSYPRKQGKCTIQRYSSHVFDGSDPVNHIFSECIFSRLCDLPDHTQHLDHPNLVPQSYPTTKTILTNFSHLQNFQQGYPERQYAKKDLQYLQQSCPQNLQKKSRREQQYFQNNFLKQQFSKISKNI